MLIYELRKKWGTRIAMSANVPYPSFQQIRKIRYDCCGTMHGFMKAMLKLHEYI